MGNQTSGRGGRRPGAGRPKGAKDKSTREAGATIAELARSHAETAIAVLVQVARASESDAARVSAANAVLDRGYGKPPQAVEHAGKDGEPIKLDVAVSDRDLAKSMALILARGLKADAATD